MLNSRNYQADSQILNSGEEITSDLEEMKDPNAKVYYHHVANSVTHLPDGAQITFRGGQFVTANKEIQEFLNKISDKRGSMIYTKKATDDAISKEIQDVALTAMVQPGDQGGKGADGVFQTDMTKTLDPSTLIAKKEETSKALLKPGVIPVQKN